MMGHFLSRANSLHNVDENFIEFFESSALPHSTRTPFLFLFLFFLPTRTQVGQEDIPKKSLCHE